MLPGDGIADLPRLVGALDAAGWDGYYDVEIFSDNGAFGTTYPDSLWDVQPTDLARLEPGTLLVVLDLAGN